MDSKDIDTTADKLADMVITLPTDPGNLTALRIHDDAEIAPIADVAQPTSPPSPQATNQLPSPIAISETPSPEPEPKQEYAAIFPPPRLINASDRFWQNNVANTYLIVSAYQSIIKAAALKANESNISKHSEPKNHPIIAPVKESNMEQSVIEMLLRRQYPPGSSYVSRDLQRQRAENPAEEYERDMNEIRARYRKLLKARENENKKTKEEWTYL